MNYIINVSLNGQHFFATDKRSATYAWEIGAIYKALSECLTEERGYELSITRWENSGYQVNIEDIEGEAI